jgi:uncharacterized membrane protein YfcA
MSLFLIAVLVGLFIGAVGVGGILLIPALHGLTPLSLQSSMATALFTFIFTGIVGTALFQRRGSIDWRLALPMCAGGVVFGAVGAWANSRMDAKPLALVLAVLIVFAGVYTMFGGRARSTVAFEGRPRLQRALLVLIGAVTGFGSGLTGVGGPALSVPIMVLLGFPMLGAIGASQVIQILAALSGSAGYLWRDLVDLRLAMWLTLFEVVGVSMGVHLAHRVDARRLRDIVGVLCIVVGSALVLRTL